MVVVAAVVARAHHGAAAKALHGDHQVNRKFYKFSIIGSLERTAKIDDLE